LIEEKPQVDGAAPPNATQAPERLAGYAVLAPFVRDKRVLDLGCGEGFGSWLLKEWGAREVVGVDVSNEAIEVGRKHFGREGVIFHVGDAYQAHDFLAYASFDVIVSFETIEHEPDPHAFLNRLRQFAASGAGIFIGCPNGHIAIPADNNKTSHLRKYTFEEFKSLAENVLGGARQWLLGANIQGYGFIPDGHPYINKDWDDRGGIPDTKALCMAHLLPGQAQTRPDRSNVLYYLGVWGVDGAAAAIAVSAQSYSALIEPWKALEWQRSQCLTSQADLIESRNQILALTSLVTKLGDGIRRLQAEALGSRQQLEEREGQIQAEIMGLRHHLEERDKQVAFILKSKSWRLTKPVRVLGRVLRGEFGLIKESLRTLRKNIEE